MKLLSITNPKAYSLLRRKDTEELHLFEGDMQPDKTCTVPNKSICLMMIKAESDKTIFSCKNENDARVSCANQGRKVCGVCVSHLYATYGKKQP